MAGGHMRVPRVRHQRHPQGLEGPPRQFRPPGTGGGRQRIAVNMGEVDTHLLEQPPSCQHTATAPAASRALPDVFPEQPLAVQRLERITDAVLKAMKVILDAICSG